MDVIIDSGCPIGKMNIKNMELIEYALKGNKKVISFRKKEEALEFYGDDTRVIYCASISEIIRNVKKYELTSVR